MRMCVAIGNDKIAIAVEFDGHAIAQLVPGDNRPVGGVTQRRLSEKIAQTLSAGPEPGTLRMERTVTVAAF